MALRMETLEKQGVPDHVSIEDFLDVSPGFFWCLDGSMRFSFVSEGVLGISGLEAAEHLGGGFDVLGYAWAGGDDPLEAREPFQDRLVWRGSATGERVWMYLAGKPVFRPGTGFAGFVGTGISAAAPDTEDPLDDTGTAGWASGEAAGVWSLDHLAMFRDAMESLSDGFALFAADGRMMFCNGVYRKINENQPWVTDGPVTLEYIIKCNMELGLLEDAIGREEEFLAERMAHHREPRDGARLTRRTDGNVLLIQEKNSPTAVSHWSIPI